MGWGGGAPYSRIYSVLEVSTLIKKLFSDRLTHNFPEKPSRGQREAWETARAQAKDRNAVSGSRSLRTQRWCSGSKCVKPIGPCSRSLQRQPQAAISRSCLPCRPHLNCPSSYKHKTKPGEKLVLACERKLKQLREGARKFDLLEGMPRKKKDKSLIQ